MMFCLFLVLQRAKRIHSRDVWLRYAQFLIVLNFHGVSLSEEFNPFFFLEPSHLPTVQSLLCSSGLLFLGQLYKKSCGSTHLKGSIDRYLKFWCDWYFYCHTFLMLLDFVLQRCLHQNLPLYRLFKLVFALFGSLFPGLSFQLAFLRSHVLLGWLLPRKLLVGHWGKNTFIHLDICRLLRR